MKSTITKNLISFYEVNPLELTTKFLFYFKKILACRKCRLKVKMYYSTKQGLKCKFCLQGITAPSTPATALKQIFKFEIGKGIGNLTVDGVFKPISIFFFILFWLGC